MHASALISFLALAGSALARPMPQAPAEGSTEFKTVSQWIVDVESAYTPEQLQEMTLEVPILYPAADMPPTSGTPTTPQDPESSSGSGGLEGGDGEDDTASAVSSAVSTATPTTSSTPQSTTVPESSAVPGYSSVPEPSTSAVPPVTDTPSGTGKTVVYVGQSNRNATDNPYTLEDVCTDSNIDIVMLSFLHKLNGEGGLPGSDFYKFCNDKLPGTDLTVCKDWPESIKKCQDAGKKVLLSIGGATMDEDLESPEELAETIWKLFGEGEGLEDKRPYGDVVLDGFDLDIENHKPKNWVEFAKAMKELYKTGTKEYILAAAPQCPRPDESLQGAVYEVDHLYIQFYNNPKCMLDNIPKSFGEWSADVSEKNPNVKIFVGVPGAPAAAPAGGYLAADDLAKIVEQVKSDSHYGGLMTWDYFFAKDNEDGDFLPVLRQNA